METVTAIVIEQENFQKLQREIRSLGSYGCLTAADMMRVASEIHSIRTQMFKVENRTRKLEKDLKRFTGGN
jgi:hypothetical protein